jgi:hypothetical protein
MAIFRGGPYDGRTLTADELNTAGLIVPVATPTGDRMFVLLPLPEALDRVLAGEVDRGAASGTQVPYERVRPAGGGAGYEYAGGGEFAAALAAETAPLGPEEAARARWYAEIAGRLVGQVRAAEIGPATEVWLLRYYEDRDGGRWGPERVDITGRTVARRSAAGALATALHRETVEDMIDAWVARHPPGFISPPGRPDEEYVLADAAVEVVQPDD